MLLFYVVNNVCAVQYQPDGSCSPSARSRAKLTMWPSLFISLSVSWCLLGMLLRVSSSTLTPRMLVCLFPINLRGVFVSLCMCVGCSPALFPGGKWKHNPLEFNQTGLKKASIHKAIKVTNCMITVFTLTAQKPPRNAVTSSLTHCVAKSGFRAVNSRAPSPAWWRFSFSLIHFQKLQSNSFFVTGPISICFKCDRSKVPPVILC